MVHIVRNMQVCLNIVVAHYVQYTLRAAGLSKVVGCSCAEVASAFHLVEVGTVVSNVPHGTSGVEVRDDAHDGVDARQGRRSEARRHVRRVGFVARQVRVLREGGVLVHVSFLAQAGNDRSARPYCAQYAGHLAAATTASCALHDGVVRLQPLAQQERDAFHFVLAALTVLVDGNDARVQCQRVAALPAFLLVDADCVVPCAAVPRTRGVQDTAVLQGGRPDETHRRQGIWLGAVLGNQVCSQLRTNTTNAGVNSGNVARDMCIL
jgi:hypothetical protein